MAETVWLLDESGINCADARRTAKETVQPVLLHLPKPANRSRTLHDACLGSRRPLGDWGQVPGIQSIDYGDEICNGLKNILISSSSKSVKPPDSKIFSTH